MIPQSQEFETLWEWMKTSSPEEMSVLSNYLHDESKNSFIDKYGKMINSTIDYNQLSIDLMIIPTCLILNLDLNWSEDDQFFYNIITNTYSSSNVQNTSYKDLHAFAVVIRKATKLYTKYSNNYDFKLIYQFLQGILAILTKNNQTLEGMASDIDTISMNPNSVSPDIQNLLNQIVQQQQPQIPSILNENAPPPPQTNEVKTTELY